MYEKITQDNWMMFAIKHYNNPECEGEQEFKDDLKKFKFFFWGDVLRQIRVVVMRFHKFNH